MVRAGIKPSDGRALVWGSALLWGPFALGIDRCLRNEVADGSVRVALALAGSYGLSSSTYLLLSYIAVPIGFYVVQASVVLAVLILAFRAGTLRRREKWMRSRTDWFLIGLVALSLFTTAPYTQLDKIEPSGAHTLLITTDSAYYASQAYELARHVPAAQEPTRAGTPPRAYHMLPHLSTALLAKSTGQHDLLRSQMTSHLTVITVLVCLLLFGLGKVLTRRALGGYALIALLYPLALITPPLLGETTVGRDAFMVFFFTPLPQVSSMLDPVMLGSWQTYSSIPVIFGVLLALAAASERIHARASATALLCIAGLLVAALARYRIQAFLVLAPAFGLVLGLVWLRSYRRDALIAAGFTLGTSMMLLLEASSQHYLGGSGSISLGFNGLTQIGRWFGRVIPSLILADWPFSRAVRDFLLTVFPRSTFDWTWQIVCLTAFVVLNAVGVALVLATVHYFTRPRAWSELRLVTIAVLVATIGSIAIGVLVKSDYDTYSLAGQALYLPPWYLLPVASVPVVGLVGRLQRRFVLPSKVWLGIGITLVAVGAIAREVQHPSRAASFEYARSLEFDRSLSAERWSALVWLRERTPTDSVIISWEYTSANQMFSGIAGRAGYLENYGDQHDVQAETLYNDHRLDVLTSLWNELEPARFCDILRSTPATYLVECSTARLAVTDPQCLKLAWLSPTGEVRIWRTQ